MMRISMRRARDAGLPAGLGLCVPALILGDFGFAIAFSSFWGTRFALGILSVPTPWFLFTAVGCVIALAILPTARPGLVAMRGSRIIDQVTLVLLGLVLISVALSLTVFVLFLQGSAQRSIGAIALLGRIDPRVWLRSSWQFLPIAAFVVAIASASMRRFTARRMA
jgi:hypothetical protein